MEKTKILVFLIVHFVGALITIIIDCLNGRMEMAIKKGDGIRLETPSDLIFLDLGKMSEILDNSIFEMKAKKCFNNKITC